MVVIIISGTFSGDCNIHVSSVQLMQVDSEPSFFTVCVLIDCRVALLTRLHQVLILFVIPGDQKGAHHELCTYQTVTTVDVPLFI